MICRRGLLKFADKETFQLNEIRFTFLSQTWPSLRSEEESNLLLIRPHQYVTPETNIMKTTLLNIVFLNSYFHRRVEGTLLYIDKITCS